MCAPLMFRVRYVENIEAAHHLAGARRICVVGCSGGGKTTLSRHLADRLRLPHVSMDREFFWLPGWISRPKAEQRTLIAAAVAGERWLMDGTNPSTFDLRLPRTDLIVWVRVPRYLCLWGLACRVLSSFGRVRADMAPGCPEQLPDREFLSYIWNFERRFSPLIIAGIDGYAPHVPVFMLKSRRDIARLLDLAGSPD